MLCTALCFLSEWQSVDLGRRDVTCFTHNSALRLQRGEKNFLQNRKAVSLLACTLKFFVHICQFQKLDIYNNRTGVLLFLLWPKEDFVLDFAAKASLYHFTLKHSSQHLSPSKDLECQYRNRLFHPFFLLSVFLPPLFCLLSPPSHKRIILPVQRPVKIFLHAS